MLFVRHLIEFVLGCLVLLSPWLVLLSLPLAGMSPLSGPAAIAVGGHFLASVTAILGLVYMAAAPSDTWRSAAIAAIAVALMGLPATVTSLDSVEPGLSWYGAVEQGIGALWFIEVGIMTFAASIVWRTSAIWRAALIGSATFAAFTCLVSAFTDGADAVPVDWAFFPAAVAGTLLVITRNWLARAIGILLFGAAAATGSLIPIALLLLALFGAIMFERMLAGRTDRSIGVFGVLALVGAIAAFGLLGPFLQDAISNKRRLPLEEIDIFQETLAPLWQRSIVLQTVFRSFDDNPISFFGGYGFGRLEELMVSHGTWLPVRLFPDHVPTAAITFWDVRAPGTATMSGVLVAAGGLAGTLFWAAGLWLIVLIGRRAGARHSFTVIALMTFGLCLAPATNALLGFIPLAIANIAAASGTSRKRHSISEIALPIVMSIFAITTAVATSLSMLGVYSLRLDVAPIHGIGNETCPMLDTPTMPNAALNSALLETFVERTTSDAYDVGKIIADPAWQAQIDTFMCRSERYALDGNKAALITSLMVRAKLAKTFDEHGVEMPAHLTQSLLKWGADLRSVVAHLHRPGHMIIQYLDWATAHYGNPRAVEQDADFLLSQLPSDDPVRYWILARKAAFEGDVERSNLYMKESIQRGLANLTPITLAQIQSLQNP